VRTVEGWRIWGTVDASDVPVLESQVAATLPRTASLVKCPHTDMTDRGFRTRVRSVIEAILAGDVYVLNLTRRIAGQPSAPPSVAFASLLSRCGADMGAFWATPELTIASASPERFVRISGDSVEVCPIKGTRPRARGAADRAMADELRTSEKERAEHVMIVDLVRNDLGRVCRPGSVTVDPLFEVVSTPYCHQMVSSVTGCLQQSAPLSAVLESTFPCGSVTGAPKIAAMKAISALEESPRAAYTGALVVAIPGEMDSSILIRTAEYAEGLVRWGTGGGITVDSDAAEEWLETELKASPFLGDGVPDVALRETCRVVDGAVPLLLRHLARLAAGGCGPTTLASVRECIKDAIECQRTPLERLSVTVDSAGHAWAELSSVPSSLDVADGVIITPVVSETPALPSGAAKPMERALWDRAQREAARLGADQALLVDTDGRIIDGATASVWVRVGTRLLTPPAPPAVDGIARGVVFDHATQCGYEAVERALTLGDLEMADEVFMSNALAGVVPVRGRSGRAVSVLGDVFLALFAAREEGPTA
jgi:para-aminobenzoate synthetase/4-amino-4-deoxychorismate lyase